MKCKACETNFNENSTPICPSCGADHAEEIRELRKVAAAERRRRRALRDPNVSQAAVSAPSDPSSDAAPAAGRELIERLTRQAKVAAQRGQDDAVGRLAQSVFELDPNHLEMLELWGETLVRRGAFDEALALYAGARERMPDLPQLEQWTERVEQAREEAKRQNVEEKRHRRMAPLHRLRRRFDAVGDTLSERGGTVAYISMWALLAAAGVGLVLLGIELLTLRLYFVAPLLVGCAVGWMLREPEDEPPRLALRERMTCAFVVGAIGYLLVFAAPGPLHSMRVAGVGETINAGFDWVIESLGFAPRRRVELLRGRGRLPQPEESQSENRAGLRLEPREGDAVGVHVNPLGLPAFYVLLGCEMLLAGAMATRVSR